MSPAAGTHQAQGERVGLWMVLPEGTTEAEVRVALSHTDAEGARGNHAAELEGRSFDAILQSAESAWDEQLGRVRVRGGTAEQRVIFHTAHYHAEHEDRHEFLGASRELAEEGQGAPHCQAIIA